MSAAPSLAEIARAVADELERRGLVTRRRSTETDAANEPPLSREERQEIAAKVRARSKRLGLRSRAAR